MTVHFDSAAMLSFDLETTGTDPRTARIVTSALVTIANGAVTPIELLADPGVEIPAEATAVHGITTDYARAHGQPHDEVLDATIEGLRAAWAQGQTVVVFNAPYDLSVLRALRPDFTVDGGVIDPLTLDRHFERFRRGKRTLGTLCEAYGVKLEDAHHATSDALAAARLAWMMAHKWPELTEKPMSEIMELQVEAHFAYTTKLAEYFRSQGREVNDMNTSWPMMG